MTKFKANNTLDLITIDRLNDGVIIMNVAVYLKRVTTLQEAYKGYAVEAEDYLNKDL
jgi:hypothetical protein